MNFDLLREVILERAIQGKLVPQLESEPDVVSTGTAPNNAPLDIPNKWKWVQIKSIEVKRKIIEPHSLVDDEVELWSIPSYDIGKAQVVPPSSIGSNKKIVFAGDVLLAKIVPHIKRAWVVSEENTSSPKTKLASTEWLIYRSAQFLPDFLVLLFKSPYFRSKMTESISGMGSLKRANPKAISKIWVPLPPKKEQARIISKVNDLLYNVNFIEKAYKELIALQDLLQKQILRKAIHGRLVPQLEREPEADIIGEQPKDIPFNAPRKWKWVKLSNVATLLNGRAYSKSELLSKAPGRVPVLRVGNFFTNSSWYYSDLKLEPNKYCDNNDLLFAWSASFGPKIWNGGRCIYHYHIWKVLCSEYVDKEWLYFWLLSMAEKLKNTSGRGSTMIHITKKETEQTPLALPPIEEQRRIVRTIKSLFRYFDDIISVK